MKNSSYGTLLRKIYSYLNDGYFRPAIGYNTPSKKVVVGMSSYGSSFSTYRDGKYYISIDSDFFYDNVKEKRSLITKEDKDLTLKTMYYMMGLFYHEFGHVMFTCFNTDKVFDEVPKEHQGIVHYLFNILEDPFIELQTYTKIKRSKKFFDFLVKNMFEDKASEYEDNKDFQSFAYYLLLAMRIGIAKIPSSNEFYDNHKKDIVSIVGKFYKESDGEKRAAITIELYKYLLDNGMDLSQDVPAGSDVVSSSDGDAPESGESRSASAVSSSRLGDEVDSDVEDESKSETESGTDKSLRAPSKSISVEESKGEVPSTDVSAGDFEAPTVDEFGRYDEYSSGIATHEFVNLKEFAKVEQYFLDSSLEYYNNTVSKFNNIVNSCIESIDSFNTEHQVRMESGYNSGYLDLDSYLRCNPIDRIYARPDGVDNTPDLSFYIMVDGSGSMRGDKARLCTQAMMILYECLTQLDIPFELSTFTNTGDCDDTKCLTYVMKSFEDDASMMKPYLTFTDSDKYSGFELPLNYYMFWGNYDEVNVGYCGERLLNRENKDKVMIILSDGATCGSIDALRDKVKWLESEGVLVLGIGICSRSVEMIYDNHVIFSSSRELESFPEFLTKFLVNLYHE